MASSSFVSYYDQMSGTQGVPYDQRETYGNLQLIGRTTMNDNKAAIRRAYTEVAALQGMTREEIQRRFSNIGGGLLDTLGASTGRMRHQASKHIFGLPAGQHKSAINSLAGVSKILKEAVEKAIVFVVKALKAVRKFVADLWIKIAGLFAEAQNACSF